MDTALDRVALRSRPRLFQRRSDELGEHEHLLHEGPARWGRVVQLGLGRRCEDRIVLAEVGKRGHRAEQRPGEPVELVDDDPAGLPVADVVHDLVEHRPVHRPARHVQLGPLHDDLLAAPLGPSADSAVLHVGGDEAFAFAAPDLGDPDVAGEWEGHGAILAPTATESQTRPCLPLRPRGANHRADRRLSSRAWTQATRSTRRIERVWPRRAPGPPSYRTSLQPRAGADRCLGKEARR